MRGQSLNSGEQYKGNFVDKYINRSELIRPSLLQTQATADITREKLETIVDHKTFISQRALANQIQTKTNSQYIKYTPKNDPENSRIVKIQEVAEDPFAPPQYKSKKIPQGPGSPPRVILRSPPRKITEDDQKQWKVPPCISNWKNSKGYTIPLEMRLSADGRTHIKPTINEGFAQFSSALYAAEKQARKDLGEKEKVQQALAFEEMKRTEEELRLKAQKAREQREKMFQMSHLSSKIENDSRYSRDDPEMNSIAEKQRDVVRAIIQKENERNMRLEKASVTRAREVKERERDISEQIALGQNVAKDKIEPSFDTRLMNADAGVGTGFKDEEEYDLYDKPLFKEQEKFNIYAQAKNVNFHADEEGYMENLLSKRKLKNLGGATNQQQADNLRIKPVEFERLDTSDRFKNTDSYKKVKPE
jgi:SNW domain-containing protein 1